MNAPTAAVTLTTTPAVGPSTPRAKVPVVTGCFWMITILGTTVGQTTAYHLDGTLGLGRATIVVAATGAAAAALQFRTRRYVPAVYWLVVVLIGVAGTSLTDDLVDGDGVSLTVTTIAFAVAVGLTFIGWYRSERTLSIHSVVTARRERWYWLAVLFTVALGTSAGDLVSDRLAVGYRRTGVIVLGLIGLLALAHVVLGRGDTVLFWLAYLLARPLGASFGDYLRQPHAAAGLGLGTGLTTFTFLAVIIAGVTYLSISRADVEADDAVVR